MMTLIVAFNIVHKEDKKFLSLHCVKEERTHKA